MTVIPPPRGSLVPTWSHTLSASPLGLALAREKNWLLTWDANHWLYVFDAQGRRQAQVCLSGVVVAACADDGSALAAADDNGNVWWLAPDLSKRWSRVVPERALALALDPFGQYLAVADARANIRVFDRTGREVSQSDGPRPLHFLAFVPAAPYLVGSADFGLVACLDLEGRWTWRDGLVVHIGSLAVSGDGQTILLACFTEGLRRYTVTGKNVGRLSAPEPCRLACLSFDGRLVLAAGLSHRLLLLDGDGQGLALLPLDKPAVGLALSALGDRAYAVLPDGQVTAFDLQGVTG